MSQRTYSLACASIFFVVGAAHLTRLILGWDVMIAGWTVPHWISIPGLIVPGLLAAWGFKLASQLKSPA